ncbi:hypothetical protein [Natrinema salinisoli]|uniref:hypothetical protein n=1 Tax=Natrinema salinisoli TaxID=2878535 RepID=UPI001CF0A96D|nr:hypothetical protein [Natrinema salinisoli]
MQRGEERYAPDFLQRVLSEFELQEADVQRQQSVEQMESDGRLKPQQLDKQLARRKSEIDSLERESDTLLDKALPIRTRIEERREEDDFKDNKRDNAIDTADWERAMTLLDRYEEIIVKLGLEKEATLVTMMDLEDLVDEQQRIQAGKEYLDQAKEMVNLQQDFNQQQTELLREFIKQQTERTVDAVESVSEQQVHVNELLEIVTDIQEHVAEDAESSLMDALEDLQEQLEDVEEGISAVDPEDQISESLSDTERRIVALLEEDPELSDTDLAQKVSVKKNRAEELRDGLEEKGIVPPRPGPEDGG